MEKVAEKNDSKQGSKLCSTSDGVILHYNKIKSCTISNLDSKRGDYVLTSIEALKGSSGDEISDHDDPQMFALSQAAGRLRGIIALVNSGYLTMEILLNNLEAAARISASYNP